MIRLLLPFGVVVQANFAPTDTLQHLHAFVKFAVLQPKFRDSFSLFVTPPKTVFKRPDLQATFWDRGMVPGAYVHVSIDVDIATDGLCTEQASQPGVYKQFLRSEVLAREADSLPEPRKAAEQAPPSAGRSQGPTRIGGAFKTSQSSKVMSSGKPVPKWFKMGK